MIDLKRFVFVGVMGLLAGGASAAEGPADLLALMDSGQVAKAVALVDGANLTGAAFELVEARLAIEKEQWHEALRHLAQVEAVYYREREWQPAALFYEALVDLRMGADVKKASALDELKQLYPASPWCCRAEQELSKAEEGVSE